MRRIILLTALATTPAAAQVAQFRGDAARTGTHATVMAGHPGIRWRAHTGGPVRSSPAVTATRVFVGSNDSVLYAFDRATGRVVWRYRAGGMVASSPAVTGGLVIAAVEGRVFAVDERTGRPRWSVATGALLPHDFDRGAWDYYLSSPAVADGTVYIGAGDGALYALDVRTGSQRWRAQTGGRIRSSPAVTGDIVIVGSWDAKVYAFDAATGTQRWVHATVGDTLVSARWGFDRRAVQGSAAVDGGGAFIGSRDGGLYGLDLASGARRFRATHRGSWVVGSPAVRGGVAIVGSSDGRFIHAVDGATGRELWRHATADNVLASPLWAGDLLVAGGFDGSLIALDARTGARRWRLNLGAPVLSSPAAFENELYVGTDDGSVVAIHQAMVRVARLAVFWDTTMARFAFTSGGRMVRDYLEQQGYQVLGADSLAAFMQARIGDTAPSVVVFALDHLPRTVVPAIADTVLFRRYLDAGGKVVWFGLPAGALARDSAGAIASYVAERMDTLIGVPAASINFNQQPVVPTDEGRRWGLLPSGHGENPVDPSVVSVALGINADGKTAAWVKTFPRGGPGSGFVQLWSNPITWERLPMIRDIAEYGITRPVSR